MKNSRGALKRLAAGIDPLDRDLSDILRKGEWKRVRFELKPKNRTVTIRMSEDLLDALKVRAKRSGLDYQKFIRIALERLLY